MARRITQEELIERLQGLAARLGRTPRCADVIAAPDVPSVPTFNKYFGSLAAAIEQAGLLQPQQAAGRTPEEVDAALRRVISDLGRVPRAAELTDRQFGLSLQAVQKACGSYEAALARIGRTKPTKRSPNRNITNEQLIDELLRVAREDTEPLTRTTLHARGCTYSVKLYDQRFGSWAASMEAAGLMVKAWSRVPPRAALARGLKDLAKRIGRPPSIRDIEAAPELPSAGSVCKVFGSLRAALSEAGLGTAHLPIDPAEFSDEELLAALKELHERIGRSPDTKIAQFMRGFPGPEIYRSRFGSWKKALQAAELDFVHRKFKANDGHWCDSRSERMIDDFLHVHGVAHEPHPLYPRHPDLNPNQSRIADWELGDGAFVEYWGVMGHEWYENKIKAKRALAAATGVRLIEICPDDLDERWERLREIFFDYIEPPEKQS